MTELKKYHTFSEPRDGHFIDWISDEVHKVDGKYHKDGAPAVIKPNGDEIWFCHGHWHRLDGPAVLFNGSPGWWIHGTEYTFEEYVSEAEWTDEQIIEWKLTHD